MRILKMTRVCEIEDLHPKSSFRWPPKECSLENSPFQMRRLREGDATTLLLVLSTIAKT